MSIFRMAKITARKMMDTLKFRLDDPVDSFHSNHYLRHNARRLEHLASLRIRVAGMSVLETDAGIGDHSHFYIDRGCRITITDARPENLRYLRSRFPGCDVQFLDMDHPADVERAPFDNRLTKSFGFIYRRSYWKTKLKFLGIDMFFFPNVVIHNPDKVVIGSHCAIAEFVHIWGGCGVTIGDNVMIASHVSITSSTHSPEASIMRNSLITAPVVIENNVWIGAHAVILPGVTIKSGSVIAAGAVVTRDVPSNVIVAGSPATIMKHIKRSVEQINGKSN